MRKPMLASDADLSKVKFPCIVQPKIDGVRALSQDGEITGRSLKKFRNKHVNSVFTRPDVFEGLDGEMTTRDVVDPHLCSKTTGDLGRIEGVPDFVLWVFDYLTDATVDLPYIERYALLETRVNQELRLPFIRVVPSKYVTDMEGLLAAEEEYLTAGYEGLIIRDPRGYHKEGRSTVKEGGLLRLKRFQDAEGIVVGLEEGLHNGNEAKTNELGHTERSTCKGNMVPNGQVGTIIVSVSEDIKVGDRVIVPKGGRVEISPGRMTKAERLHFWENKRELFDRAVKFKFFPQGIKDGLRFATFQGFRMEEDMS